MVGHLPSHAVHVSASQMRYNVTFSITRVTTAVDFRNEMSFMQKELNNNIFPRESQPLSMAGVTRTTQHAKRHISMLRPRMAWRVV